MSEKSAIEWCDATWNPTTGCTKVSPGCANCYIEHTTPFRVKGRKFIAGAIPLMLHNGRLEQPLRWKKPKRIFVNSLSDLFHEHIPDEFIDRVFAVMALTPQHTYQILTKRADRMRSYITTKHCLWNGFPDLVGPTISTHDQVETWCREQGVSRDERERRVGIINNAGGFEFGKHRGWPLPNVWLGVSAENQHFADERIQLLQKTPAAVRFISAEPLLGFIDIRPYLPNALWNDLPSWKEPELDWVIVGGESGDGARPFDIAWARSIQAQCKAAGVAVFVKQLGQHAVSDDVVPSTSKGFPLKDTPARSGRRLVLSKKGGNQDEWPEDLRVREFPAVRA